MELGRLNRSITSFGFVRLFEEGGSDEAWSLNVKVLTEAEV